MRNKIDPAKNIGLVCCGGRIGNEKQEPQVDIRPIRWPELRSCAKRRGARDIESGPRTKACGQRACGCGPEGVVVI
jgi:hypothetical protein